jgi:HlyD family secretion protein
MKRKLLILLLLLAAIGGALLYAGLRRERRLVLTGIVTTDGVIVSSEIQGRLQDLFVKEGDTVRSNQLLGRIHPQEWKAEMSFYANSQQQSASQVAQAQADLHFQEAQTSNQVRQAEANLASAQAQVSQAEADLENARLSFNRIDDLHRQGVESAQLFDQTRTALAAARARVDSLRQQAQSAQAALDLARSGADQILARRAALDAAGHQLAAANDQKDRAQVRLDYTEIHSPIDGVTDDRAARPGEIVTPGQPILTLINPDDLWVRADIEETYLDRVRLDDKLDVRFTSGAHREGVVFYRAVDADFATQRDVSRTKRDIKTFELRLRCDNHDRLLAVGMTAYVTLPVRH